MSKNLASNHWTKDALCKFDKKFLSFHIDDVSEAKSICSGCPVKIECIKFTGQVDGAFISAGTSKYDRLLIQWKRVDALNESNFKGSKAYVSEIVRRIREAIHP